MKTHVLKNLICSLVLGVLFASWMSCSPSKSEKRTTASLNTHFNSVADSTHVYAIYDSIWNHYRLTDPKAGLGLASQLRRFADSLHNATALALANKCAGVLLVYLEEYPESEKYLLANLEEWESLGDDEQVANTFNNLGWLYQNSQNHQKSAEYYEKGYHLHTTLGNQHRRIKAVMGQMLAHINMKEYPKAIELGLQGIELCNTPEEQPSLAWMHCDIGKLYYLEGQTEKGREHVTHALALFKRLGDEKKAAETEKLLQRMRE